MAGHTHSKEEDVEILQLQRDISKLLAVHTPHICVDALLGEAVTILIRFRKPDATIADYYSIIDDAVLVMKEAGVRHWNEETLKPKPVA